MRYKKLLTITLALLMLLSLCACDDDNSNAGVSNDSNTKTANAVEDEKLTPYESLFANGGLCVQDENGLWGYIDKDCNYIIEPQFADAFGFDKNNELAVVKSAENGLYGYINTKGEYVIEPQFKQANKFADGLAVVHTDNATGYIDDTGQIVISGNYDEAYNFYDDMALIKQSGLYGYINHQGEMVVNPQYEDAYSFIDGVAYVSNDPSNSFSGYSLIDTEGNYISDELQFCAPIGYDLNRVPTKVAKNLYCVAQLTDSIHGNDYDLNYFVYYYVNKQGEVVLPKADSGYDSYDEARNFRYGYAVVKDKHAGAYGVIDTDGNWVISPQLKHNINLEDCDDDYIYLSKYDNKNINYYCFDKQGNLVKETKLHGSYVNNADYQRNCVLLILDSGDNRSYQFVDFDGNLIMDYTFEDTAGWRFNDTGLDCAIVKYNGLYGIIDGGGNWLIEPKFQNVRQ